MDIVEELRRNRESGAYANPFTDANGGVWSYHIASGVAPFTELADFPAHSKMESDTMDGWICQSDGYPAHPLLLVNDTGEAVSSYCSSGNQLDADEMMFHPSAYGYAVLRFTVPQDGWYSAFASFRDVDQGSPNGLSGVDVHVTLGSDSAGDTDLATTHVTLEDYADWNAASKRTRRFDYQMPVRYLTQGTRIQFAVGPNVSGTDGHYSDGTASVVNVDFTGTGSGTLSANTARAREGYGDWLTWNALHPGSSSSTTVENCYEADGTTRRNVAVTLARTSGSAIAAGSAATGTALLDSFVASSGAEDAYSFAISKLKANEPYTLYLYSAKGRDFGNAAFTVGGVTKGVEGIWLLGGKMLTRFDVVSDANGVISGTFAAADGNGGAFNGLTLVGELPNYKSPVFTMIIR